jgi:hypothetical protein
VCFGIARQHAEVGHKNINIVGYKNHLDRFYINKKTIYIKRFTT